MKDIYGKELAIRTPEELEKCRRVGFSKEHVDAFYVDLQRAYDRAGIRGAEDSWRVINLDETGIQGDMESKVRVLAPRGTKRVEMETVGSREHISLLGIVSADGRAFPPGADICECGTKSGVCAVSSAEGNICCALGERLDGERHFRGVSEAH
jgi:hypothetical protein